MVTLPQKASSSTPQGILVPGGTTAATLCFQLWDV